MWLARHFGYLGPIVLATLVAYPAPQDSFIWRAVVLGVIATTAVSWSFCISNWVEQAKISDGLRRASITVIVTVFLFAAASLGWGAIVPPRIGLALLLAVVVLGSVVLIRRSISLDATARLANGEEASHKREWEPLPEESGPILFPAVVLLALLVGAQVSSDETPAVALFLGSYGAWTVLYPEYKGLISDLMPVSYTHLTLPTILRV